MAATGRALETGMFLFLLFGRLTCADPVRIPSSPVCPVISLKDSIVQSTESLCPLSRIYYFPVDGVFEGDEASLHKALNIAQKNIHDYVAVLFYASWCPFSAILRPRFSTLSSLYPSIPHFAIEESVVRQSILSKYGVHGFPTLLLLNSTMRVRYHGSRTLGSVLAFYRDVTGMKISFTNGPIIISSNNRKLDNSDPETCPFSLFRSPENLLHQETYLALATLFVLSRLLYLSLPALKRGFRSACTRYVLNLRLRSLWEHPLGYLTRILHLLFNLLKEPRKRSNLQEGALNAKAWASKSLASVSFGDSSGSRSSPVSRSL